jgi:hypothetical protein
MLASDFEIMGKKFPMRSRYVETISLDSEQATAATILFRFHVEYRDIEIAASPGPPFVRMSNWFRFSSVM